jgi:hypothetical protein
MPASPIVHLELLKLPMYSCPCSQSYSHRVFLTARKIILQSTWICVSCLFSSTYGSHFTLPCFIRLFNLPHAASFFVLEILLSRCRYSVVSLEWSGVSLTEYSLRWFLDGLSPPSLLSFWHPIGHLASVLIPTPLVLVEFVECIHWF